MESMGRRKRSFAFLIVVGGILRFFLRLVTTDPPVMGRTRWSGWNIACQVQAGNMPPVRHYSERNEFLLSIPLMAATIYLLLVVALIALCFSCSPEVLAKIAVVGWCTSWFWRGDRIRDVLRRLVLPQLVASQARWIWPTHDCAPRSHARSLSGFEKRGYR